ncbi:MAG: spondin domain-containing protein [Sulfurimonas sp.]
MKSTFTKIALSSALIFSSSLMALEIDVKITNLTKGISFTPLLVSAHNANAALFMAGSVASSNLKAMAEGGDISGLVTDLNASGATSVQNPASGLLSAGSSTTTSLSTASGNDYLSIVAMMLPTNDGFLAMNSVKIPTTVGTYKYELNAYDAGTEANDELAGNIPALATGSGGTGVSTTSEGFVHIHRGNVGDFDASAGLSDLNAATDRFLNPVASVVITVK